MILEEGIEKTFANVYTKIVQDISNHSDHQDMDEINVWLSKVMNYNVPNGKRIRGLMTVEAYRSYGDSEEIEQNMEKACILGWCVEILHAAHKMYLNIIEEIPKSRGEPSWHNWENMGSVAFNDAILLTGAMYYLLKLYFEEEDYYGNLLNIFHEAQLFGALGQNMKMKTNVEKEIRYLNKSRYEAIVKYKISHFSFYFPVAAGMHMAGVKKEASYEDAQDITYKIGFLSQVIKDQKQLKNFEFSNKNLNWHLFEALYKSNNSQRETIKDFYGNENEKKSKSVTNIFSQMKLDEKCKIFIQNENNEISSAINSSDNLPHKLYFKILKTISY